MEGLSKLHITTSIYQIKDHYCTNEDTDSERLNGQTMTQQVSNNKVEIRTYKMLWFSSLHILFLARVSSTYDYTRILSHRAFSF